MWDSYNSALDLAYLRLSKKWEEERQTEKQEEQTTMEYPPYFMTINEAVEFIRKHGYSIRDRNGSTLLTLTVESWERKIRENCESL